MMNYIIFLLGVVILVETCRAETNLNMRHTEHGGEQLEKMREDRIDLIFPGTKWCGLGNISKSEDDLGIFKKTDACCRTHDHCPDYMDGHQTKHNLTNPSFFTRLACDCDTEFYNCLKKADTLISDKIGFFYFNILSTQCYKLEYPIKKCTRVNYTPRKKCENYELDNTKEKVYQFFDIPSYF